MAFAAGARLSAQVLNNAFPESKDDRQNTAGTTISTSFVTALTGGTQCGVSFTAPTSGKVEVFVYARLRNSGANASLVSPRVATGSTVGSGTLHLASSDNSCIQNGTATDIGAAAIIPVTGLTPGSLYNVVMQQRVTAGTGTFTSRVVKVLPVV